MSQSGLPDLEDTPAAAPPPGQVPNFVDPPSQQAVMIAVSTVMIVLTLAFVSLRMYTSLRITRAPGAEDWLCLLAMVLSFAYIGIILSLSHVSRHMWDVPEIWFTENYWKIRYAGNTIQAFAYFTSRLPIFLLYLRLFGLNKRFRIFCYLGIAADFAIYLTAVPLLSYFCTPPPGGDWNSLNVFAQCEKLLDWAVIQGSLDIVLDLFIFILPLPIVLGLQMPSRRKLGVLAIFLTGSLAVIASVVGFYYRHQLTFTPDVNWNEGAYICTAVVEINIAIICSCMPACASFFKHSLVHSSFFGSVRRIFSRYVLSSSSRNESTKPSSGNAYIHGSTDSRAGLPDNGYMELQDSKGTHGVTNEDYTAGVQANLNRPALYRPGIVKTVELEVV